MNRDTIGAAIVPAGLVLTATHAYSGAADILTTVSRPMSIDKTKWPAALREKDVKELWFKSSVIVTFSQNLAETEGLITFAANTWWVLPIESNMTQLHMKGANNTNTTEYYFVVA